MAGGAPSASGKSSSPARFCLAAFPDIAQRTTGAALVAGPRWNLLPDNRLVTYRLDIRRVLTSKLKLAIADGQVAVDGRTIYTAESLRVGLFTGDASF